MFSNFNFFGSSVEVNILHYSCQVLCSLALIKSWTKSRVDSGLMKFFSAFVPILLPDSGIS